MTNFYTIGHSTRSADEFLEFLQAHGIQQLVDVRRYPGSRRYPHFGSDALKVFLSEAGIAYVHEPDLGGRRQPDADSPNDYWRNAQFRAYADYMAAAPFREAITRLISAAAQGPTAVMCAEAVPWRCHRQLIADVLVSRGFPVLNIMSATKADPHVLNPHAVVQDAGTLVYKADTAGQRELFS